MASVRGSAWPLEPVAYSYDKNMSSHPSLCVSVGGSAACAASQDGCLGNSLVRDVTALARTSDHWQDFPAAETLAFHLTALLFVPPLPCEKQNFREHSHQLLSGGLWRAMGPGSLGMNMRKLRRA